MPLSPTALNLTVLPTKNPGADYYVMNFRGGEEGTKCTVYASERQFTCIFKSLKAHTMYWFEYYAGANAPGHDIWSDMRQRSGMTPSNCKSESFSVY